jgi:hypothetical protein
MRTRYSLEEFTHALVITNTAHSFKLITSTINDQPLKPAG